MSSTTEKRERQKARRAERLAEEAALEHKRGVRRRLLQVIGGIVAVAAVVGLGVLLVRGTDVSLGVSAATVVSGDPLPSVPTGGVDPAIGAPAPEVQGNTPDGGDVTIGGDGQAQAVVFVAHWCPHCQDEIPKVLDWVNAGDLAEGVELVAVSTLQDPARPNWPPDEWLAAEGFPGEVLIDSDETAAEAWGLTGTPMWVFTDADGTVVSRLSGEITPELFAEATAAAAGSAPAG